MTLNLLSEPLMRVVVGGVRAAVSLPGLYAALDGDRMDCVVALRPHQRQALHSLLVQVGVLAARRLGRVPVGEVEWSVALRGLTPGYAHDEPWHLVGPIDAPAFLQPPVQRGEAAFKKELTESPGDLDVLITSRNHDVKVGKGFGVAEPDDWCLALVALQTTQGFLGPRNYGVSRMNGGFANRSMLGVAPAGGMGAHVMRDIRRLFEIDPVASDRIGLVWLVPWDGATKIGVDELAPGYVEVCRLVRLRSAADGTLHARTGGSTGTRIVESPGGLTDDPWAPRIPDDDRKGGADWKSLSLDASGFHYGRLVKLLFGGDKVQQSTLQRLADSDDRKGLRIVALALARGQGKTQGFHEASIPLSAKAGGILRRQSDTVAGIANARVAEVGKLQGSVLRSALFALVQNGADKISFDDKSATRKVDACVATFDAQVDAAFFHDLWVEVEADDPDAARARWREGLVDTARAVLDRAARSVPRSGVRHWRAVSKANAVFGAGLHKLGLVAHALEEDKSHVA